MELVGKQAREIENLRRQVTWFQRQIFGQKSERRMPAVDGAQGVDAVRKRHDSRGIFAPANRIHDCQRFELQARAFEGIFLDHAPWNWKPVKYLADES